MNVSMRALEKRSSSGNGSYLYCRTSYSAGFNISSPRKGYRSLTNANYNVVVTVRK